MWPYSNFQGLFPADFGPRTSFPAGSFEISPAGALPRSFDSIAHSRFLQGSPGIGGGGREGEATEGVCVESGLWGRRRRRPRPPFIALLRQYPPQQKSRHGSTDRPTDLPPQTAKPLLSLLPLLSSPCGWKARSSDLTLVPATNYQIS